MQRVWTFAARTVAILVTGVTAAGFASGPAIAARTGPAPLTFDGRCTLAGAVAFSPLLTTSPGVVTNRATASGTCSGSLTDRRGRTTQLNNAPVAYRAIEVGSQESCELNANAPGRAELAFKAGTLGFTVVENRVSGTALLSFAGDGGGSATAVANVNSPNPPGVLEQCAMGGVASTPVDLVIQTTPTISG